MDAYKHTEACFVARDDLLVKFHACIHSGRQKGEPLMSWDETYGDSEYQPFMSIDLASFEQLFTAGGDLLVKIEIRVF